VRRWVLTNYRALWSRTETDNIDRFVARRMKFVTTNIVLYCQQSWTLGRGWSTRVCRYGVYWIQIRNDGTVFVSGMRRHLISFCGLLFECKVFINKPRTELKENVGREIAAVDANMLHRSFTHVWTRHPQTRLSNVRWTWQTIRRQWRRFNFDVENTPSVRQTVSTFPRSTTHDNLKFRVCLVTR